MTSYLFRSFSEKRTTISSVKHLFMKKKLTAGKSWFARLSFIKKSISIVILLGLLGFAGYTVFGQQSNKTTYQTSTAEKGTLITSVTASGSVSSASSASITSSATGIVTEVYVSNGDSVEDGDTIAEMQLDKSSQQKAAAAYASYLSAKNALNTANAKLNSLQSALFTANQKFVNGAGTENPIEDDPTYVIQRADWLQAEADYNNQKGVIAQAQAALTSASLSYAQTSRTITAPMSGIISNLTLTKGLSIASSTTSSDTTTTSSQSFGSVVLEGGQTQALVNLSEIDITTVKIGQKATITMDAFPDKTFTGKVAAINTTGSVSSGVTSYPVTLTFDAALPTIYPNMTISASVITNVKSDALLVPSSAVQTTDGESTVQILKDGNVTSVSVEIGDSNDTHTAILSGLVEGDTVITSTSATSSTQNNTSSPFGATGFGGSGGGPRMMQR
jgi:RND family efflux transporter MFP subunit